MHTRLQSSLRSKITLRNARRLRGYTLKEVAKEARVSVGALSRYERNPGETPLHIAVRLSKLYNIPVSSVDFKKLS
ncbi:helix-turn-helix domain-containing protein [Brevibacillus borstelensis]|uniref:helix-turn-helix domain-containing protein n=1 Tax=Brevibacillus borstelensis TaxID=45462 RepID=UPI0009DF45E1